MKNKIQTLIIFCIALFIFSCDSLDVENQNEPETERVLSTPEDYGSALDGAAFSWFNGLFKATPAMTLLVAADVGSSSWGNFGMRDVGTKGAPYGLGPHNAINNTVIYSYRSFLEVPYSALYATTTSANDIVIAVKNSENLDSDIANQYNAYAYFLRGIGFGYLGLLFDKALIFDEDTDLESLTYEDFVTYSQVTEQAIKDLNSAIEYATLASSIEIKAFNGATINKEQLIQIANGYAIKFIVQSARTVAETSAINWQTVASRSENANLENDFSAVGDGQTWWTHSFYSTNPGWMRVDQKIINSVNPSSPYPYPEAGYVSDEAEVAAQDARFGSTPDHQFRFAGAAPFRANRGIYFYSSWKFNEHDVFRLNGARGPFPILKAREAKLYRAEALARLGIPGAAEIVNETRVGKGQKEPATDSDPDLLDKIFYERYLELYDTPGTGFFDRRRTDDLGDKQFLHFPIPARNLNTWEAELYTTGG